MRESDRHGSSRQQFGLLLCLVGPIEFRSEACVDYLFEYIEQLSIVRIVVGEGFEGNLPAGNVVVATDMSDIRERLTRDIAGVNAGIGGPGAEMYPVVDERPVFLMGDVTTV